MNQPHMAPVMKGSGRGVDIAFLALAVVCLGLLVVLHWRLSSQKPLPPSLQQLQTIFSGPLPTAANAKAGPVITPEKTEE